jgi:malate dehydrogenase (oxaloacetate-decarboxylating)(NADP+)
MDNRFRIRPTFKHRRMPTGIDLLHDPSFNKGLGFTEAERDAFGLRGLLPPHVFTQEQQAVRVLENFHKKPTDLDKYIFLGGLQDRNQNLFYRVLIDNIEEMMPIVYTPTVGEACRQFAHIYRRPRGLYITAEDRGHIDSILTNWPEPDVRVIVISDGERILGLGDLGANGMGIPIGKLTLYTACAGIPPRNCLPILLDVGTNNHELLNDPLYLGLRQERLRGFAYDSLVEELVCAVEEVFPDALLQFEDFGNANAFRLLMKYRDRLCTFNDDIQGTAAVALGGLFTAMRITGGDIAEQRLLFFGAGEAAIGIADLFVSALEWKGIPKDQARKQCCMIDSRGLVVRNREGLNEEKMRFAHEHAPSRDLVGIIQALKPTALIGVSGQPGVFSEQAVSALSDVNDRPIVFALSNPTSKSECSAEQAYSWSGGRAVFASGSPFDDVLVHGRVFSPGQGNNAYIFPGIGLGVLASRARRVSDGMFLAAARALSELVDEDSLARGRIYPALRNIREVSRHIAAAVFTEAHESKLATRPVPQDVDAYIEKLMYRPEYPVYVSVERPSSPDHDPIVADSDVHSL